MTTLLSSQVQYTETELLKILNDIKSGQKSGAKKIKGDCGCDDHSHWFPNQ